MSRILGRPERMFDARHYQGTATLRLSPAGMDRLPQVMAPDAVSEPGAPPPGAGGRCEITLPVETVEQSLSEILRLGAEAEVLDPERSRRRMERAVRELSALYAAQG